MRRTRTSIPLALGLALCCGGVIAQEAATFTALSACRVDAERVLLRAVFEGGACMAVEPAQLAEPRGTIVAVHLPTVSTAEICTMQIVPVEVEQMVDAPEPIADLSVTVGDPQNNEIAHGVVAVEEGTADCLPERG